MEIQHGLIYEHQTKFLALYAATSRNFSFPIRLIYDLNVGTLFAKPLRCQTVVDRAVTRRFKRRYYTLRQWEGRKCSILAK
jgi:hypothetical protein